MPHRPKPPTARVWLSAATPCSASSALANTLPLRVIWTIESSPPSASPILAWARTGLAPAFRPMPPHTALPPRNRARLAPRRPNRSNRGLAPHYHRDPPPPPPHRQEQ